MMPSPTPSDAAHVDPTLRPSEVYKFVTARVNLTRLHHYFSSMSAQGTQSRGYRQPALTVGTVNIQGDEQKGECDSEQRKGECLSPIGNGD